MSAQSMQCVTYVFSHHLNDTHDVHRVNASTSFFDLLTFNITTLSTSHANPSSDVEGLLYVPALASNDPCNNNTAYAVPSNVTRLDELPPFPTAYVALAPFQSRTCALSYLASAANTPNIEAFLFFLPGNSTNAPPASDDPVWDLHTAAQYDDYPYPIYVLPSFTGERLMYQSTLYSKNMTDVPYGHNLTETYDPRDYVRLWVEVDTAPTGANATLPTLWAFLLIVIGILLGVIAITSISMHLIQRRRRQLLRRRVASGEVDLEALGIKRLAVPQDILNQMPLYVYGSNPPPPAKLREHFGGNPSPGSTNLQQPTCAICLDDFVPATQQGQGTIVRELPCRHIFHPECVDNFLRDNSSLCPMCKKSALPKGYCPKVITNAMVRRERIVNRMRERVPAAEEREAGDGQREQAVGTGLGSRIRRSTTLSGISTWRANRRVTSAPLESTPAMTEMTSSTTAPSLIRSHTTAQVSAPSEQPSAPVQPAATPGRREWDRQRAISMLGRRAPEDPDVEESRNTPGWKKALQHVFPAAGAGRSGPSRQ